MKSVCVMLIAAVAAGQVFAHDHPSPAGQPGEARAVDRIITISAEDIKFSPAQLTVRAGETVKFVITNHGKLPHEFVIGATAEQQEHEQEMQSMGTMEHTDPNAVSLKPGETKTLTWKFGGPGMFQYGCHVPGHYAAGMRGEIRVAG